MAMKVISMSSKTVKLVLLISAIANLLLLIRLMLSTCTTRPITKLTRDHPTAKQNCHNTTSLDSVIFVGGVPRSGTTLTRAMLDAHPDIRCGEESRVIPRILGMRSKWNKSDKEHQRLLEAGLSDQMLDGATKAFISYVITNHGLPAKHLCNKDPLVLNYMKEVRSLYPQSKFLLMVRDGRAVAHSIVSRNVTISGVNNKDYMSAALFWNRVVTRMLADCKSLGREICLMVHYEDLVSSPQKWMNIILEFLGIPWHDNVLHHQEFINKEIALSRLEPSSNQVKEAVHTVAIDKWRDKVPLSIQHRIYSECDMLRHLGYPP